MRRFIEMIIVVATAIVITHDNYDFFISEFYKYAYKLAGYQSELYKTYPYLDPWLTIIFWGFMIWFVVALSFNITRNE